MIMLMHHEMPPVLMLVPSIQTLEVIDTQQIPLPSSTFSNVPRKLFREDREVVIYPGLAGFDGGQGGW